MLAGRWILLLLWAAIYSTCIAETHREGKFLSPFTIVTFKNKECEDGKGICYTANECTNLGGTPTGEKCAKEFGICCEIIKSCGTVTSQKVSHFTSPGGGSTTDNDALQSCTYTVNVEDNTVKQLRLDFVMFETQDPGSTLAICVNDVLSIPGSSKLGLPNLCGINTDQHVYVHIGDDKSVTLHMKIGGVVPYRWNIKITQVGTMNEPELLAPDGCIQYHTATTGDIESYNFQSGSGSYQRNLNYAICIKRAADTCRVEYEASDANFNLDYNDVKFESASNGHVGNGEGNCDYTQSRDYVYIEDSADNPLSKGTESKFCGGQLSHVDNAAARPITSYAQGPIRVMFHTDDSYDPNRDKGFKITYTQISC